MNALLKFKTGREVIRHFNPPCVYCLITERWFKVGSTHRPANRIDEQINRDGELRILIHPCKTYRLTESRIHKSLKPIKARLNHRRGKSPARDMYPNTPHTRQVLEAVIKLFEGGLASGDIVELRKTARAIHGKEARPHWKKRTLI